MPQRERNVLCGRMLRLPPHVRRRFQKGDVQVATGVRASQNRLLTTIASLTIAPETLLHCCWRRAKNTSGLCAQELKSTEDCDERTSQKDEIRDNHCESPEKCCATPYTMGSAVKDHDKSYTSSKLEQFTDDKCTTL